MNDNSRIVPTLPYIKLTTVCINTEDRLVHEYHGFKTRKGISRIDYHRLSEEDKLSLFGKRPGFDIPTEIWVFDQNDTGKMWSLKYYAIVHDCKFYETYKLIIDS